MIGAGWRVCTTLKAALNAITRMLADEQRPARIPVDSVCPGRVATGMGGKDAQLRFERGREVCPPQHRPN